jgi:hypothetical protein
MPTLYFIALTLLGGVLALFIYAGIASYQHNKLPDMETLFRWFMAGTVTSGLGSYVYLFGANGDPTTLLQNLGDAMEVNKVVETITTASGGYATASVPEKENDITVGMPGF